MGNSNKCLIVLILLSFVKLFSQTTESRSLETIRQQYQNLPKNDIRALPYVNEYINTAKTKGNFKGLTQGYRDAVLYTPDEHLKLVYSDSMIYAAEKTRDNGLLTLAYLGKGIIYYFNYKKFEPALDQYLKAYEYSRNTNDLYLKYKVVYHLGVVKSYLGYYWDALVHFNDCIGFFEKEIGKAKHQNEIYNFKRGYYNSLHQMIICYRNMGEQNKADSLLTIGIDKINRESDYSLERSYLLKCRAISYFKHGAYIKAIRDFKTALPELEKKDFSYASVVYFYLGQSLMQTNRENGIREFKRVDSIFEKHHFILPELRQNYEILISYYRDKGNIEKELFYTNRLLKVDNVLAKDFTFLSSRVHKEYDTKDLLEKKDFLERKSTLRLVLLLVISVLSTILIIFLTYRYYRERNIRLQYEKLQMRLQNPEDKILKGNSNNQNQLSILPQELIIELSEKIRKFEQKKGFTKRGLTQHELASQLGTNYRYLSIYINEVKGVSFKNYLNKLRIEYISELLNSDRKYLNYTTEALAEECGVTTRQSFSYLFREINGIRPQDYIRQRKMAMKK